MCPQAQATISFAHICRKLQMRPSPIPKNLLYIMRSNHRA
jgi:hypothetical protein